METSASTDNLARKEQMLGGLTGEGALNWPHIYARLIDPIEETPHSRKNLGEEQFYYGLRPQSEDHPGAPSTSYQWPTAVDPRASERTRSESVVGSDGDAETLFGSMSMPRLMMTTNGSLGSICIVGDECRLRHPNMSGSEMQPANVMQGPNSLRSSKVSSLVAMFEGSQRP
jgi:hypothetical protein